MIPGDAKVDILPPSGAIRWSIPGTLVHVAGDLSTSEGMPGGGRSRCGGVAPSCCLFKQSLSLAH